MDVRVKQERVDAEFESGSSQSAPWEIYGSWIDTSDLHSRDSKPKSTELIVPFSEGSHSLSNESFYSNDVNRAKREFVPDERKDNSYWAKRLKNNASARRSRLKKKVMEKHMETKLQELQKENIELKYELAALKRHFASQLDTQQDESTPDACSDLSMRTGSASDTSDSSSVTSEGDPFHGCYETDVTASPLGTLTATSVKDEKLTTVFPYQHGWHIPFNYSFLPFSASDGDRKDSASSLDNEFDALTKIPHKFRHKKDFHSAFYAHPYADNKA